MAVSIDDLKLARAHVGSMVKRFESEREVKVAELKGIVTEVESYQLVIEDMDKKISAWKATAELIDGHLHAVGEL